ncbi:hypothetical protein HOP50_17g80180 [Chloropicon primus]|nr:hypothetical protein A3770_17p79960 [Chloropicon primus]UPR04674.1 hypothetical protein HOP50_17g80180 [Chloropicon primus]|eukprot:QDZ25478.1 hypothetical protein A3770_17p79960 [Chloropicon primus]
MSTRLRLPLGLVLRLGLGAPGWGAWPPSSFRPPLRRFPGSQRGLASSSSSWTKSFALARKGGSPGEGEEEGWDSTEGARRRERVEEAVEDLLKPDSCPESLSTKPRSLQEIGGVGWIPQNREDKKCVREVLKHALESSDNSSEQGKAEVVEVYAHFLRKTMVWRDLQRSRQLEHIDSFVAKLEEGGSRRLDLSFVAYMVSFISDKERRMDPKHVGAVARYAYSHRCLGDLVDSTDWMRREISDAMLESLCREYMSLLESSEQDHVLQAQRIADLLYTASRASVSLDTGDVERLLVQFLDLRAKAASKTLSRVVSAIDAFDLGHKVPVEDLVEEFLSSMRKGGRGAAGQSGDHVATVLMAIANLSLPYTHDGIEELVGSLRVSQIRDSSLLPTLQAVRKLHWKLAYQVIEEVFGVFANKVKLTRGPGAVSEMLGIAADMGFSPHKVPLQKCLNHQLSYENRFKTTSAELLTTIHSLSIMETRVDEAYIDKIVTYFSKKLDHAENQDLATFLRCLARLNFKPSASTLLLLGRIDKHLEKNL